MSREINLTWGTCAPYNRYQKGGKMSQTPAETLTEIADECMSIAEMLEQISNDTTELLLKDEQVEILKYLVTLPATLAELFATATHKVMENAILDASEAIKQAQ